MSLFLRLALRNVFRNRARTTVALLAIAAGCAALHVEDHPGARVFVVEMRCVDEDLLIVFNGQINMFEKNGRFVARVLVQANFADTQHVGTIQELRNYLEYLAGQVHVFGFFGVDAEPCEVLDAVLRGSLGFELGQLTKIIVETFDTAAIESGPKRGLADRHAAHSG